MNPTLLHSLKNAFSLLHNRAIIRVEGKDAHKFLQGLTTNDLSLLHHHPSTSIYSNILNVQGRVAFDVLISPPPNNPQPTSSTSTEHTYFLDCAKNAAEDIQKYFDRYKLRNKVKITDISNSYRVWSVFGKSVTHSSLTHDNTNNKNNVLSVQPGSGTPEQSVVTGELAKWWDASRGVMVMDPRFEKLGARIILPRDDSPQLPATFTEVDESVYNLYRLQWGVPQGPEEIQKELLLPLECNTELLNGVHFHKGCYIGQELVSRTHYSGLIRKRLFPFVMLSNAEPPKPGDLEHGDNLFPPIIVNNLSVEIPAAGSTLNVGGPNDLGGSVSAQRDRKAGKVISGLCNVGLAMIRLESLNLDKLTATGVSDGSGRLAALLTPCWWEKEVANIKKMKMNL